jgi:hypothetical protein
LHSWNQRFTAGAVAGIDEKSLIDIKRPGNQWTLISDFMLQRVAFVACHVPEAGQI